LSLILGRLPGAQGTFLPQVRGHVLFNPRLLAFLFIFNVDRIQGFIFACRVLIFLHDRPKGLVFLLIRFELSWVMSASDGAVYPVEIKLNLASKITMAILIIVLVLLRIHKSIIIEIEINHTLFP
jgi:hypothetical protein